MKTTAALVISLTTLTLCSVAEAQTRSEHVFLLGVEQVAGIRSSEITLKIGNYEQKNKSDGLALVGGKMTSSFSADFLPIPHLSLGAKFYYDASTQSSSAEGTTAKGPSVTEWAIEPRIGYYAPLGPRVSLWLRGGVNRWNQKNEYTSGAQGQRETEDITYTSAVFSPSLLVFLAPNLALNINSTGTSIVSSNYTNSSWNQSSTSPSVSMTGQTYTLAIGLTGAL